MTSDIQHELISNVGSFSGGNQGGIRWCTDGRFKCETLNNTYYQHTVKLFQTLHNIVNLSNFVLGGVVMLITDMGEG